MALDATVGGATANSYVTRQEAIDYMATRLYTDPFDTLTDADKDKALMMATRLIDRLVCFVGTSTSTGQALRFPMVDLPAPTGGLEAADDIPAEVKEATFEMALLLATRDVTAQSEAEVEGLTKLKVGPIELGFREAIASNSMPSSITSLFPSAWLCPTTEQLNRVAVFEVL